MATVTTTTQADPLAMPGNASFARDASTGYLYTLVRTGASTLTAYRSTNGGASWASWAAFTHTNLAEWSSFIVDKNGWAHLAYRVSDTSSDTIWYRRVSTTASAPTWSGGLQTSETDPNGGVPGATWQGVDLAVVRNPNATYSIAVVGCRTQGTYRYGIQIMGVSITSGGAVSRKNGLIAGTREYWIHGVSPGRFGVSCETEHNGSGDTSANVPNLWISWGRVDVAMVKLAWSQAALGWTGPSTGVWLKFGAAAQDDRAASWDGVRWSTASINPTDPTLVEVRERNQANTKTTLLTAPPHPAGTVRQIALSYSYTSKNLRVFAVGTSTAQLYFVDYVRNTSTWTSWATVTATAVLGAAGAEFSTRHGGTFGNSRHDVVTAHAGSPNTVVHTAMTTSTTPGIATINTDGAPYTNGGAADVNAHLTIDWNFTDPDPGQTQGFYALSRQIGNGAVAYWRASDSTWQSAEVQNASASTALNLLAGWALASDAAYTFKVKVWDSAGTPAAGYSSALTLIPSAKVEPSITAPTPGGVINTDQVTVTWTAAEQTQRRVRLYSGPVVAHDTGFQAVAGTSYTVPTRLANGSAWTVEVTTTNNEGLASTPDAHAFTVSYAPPPAALPTFTPYTNKGLITVGSTALAPVGAQPAIVSQVLYRRQRRYANLTVNPSIAGDTTGWTPIGGTAVYSTAQFHDGPGSIFFTPSGAAAESRIVATGSAAPTVTAAIASGAVFEVSGWIRPTTGNKPIIIKVNWLDAGGAFVASVSSTAPAPVAGAWHFVSFLADPTSAPGAAKLAASLGLASTPAAGDTFYVDELQARVADSDDIGVRVAVGVSPGGSVDDSGPASGVDYEYRWVASGANGTSETGPWTA